MRKPRFTTFKWGGTVFTQEVLIDEAGLICGLGETRIATRSVRAASDGAAVLEGLNTIDAMLGRGGDLQSAHAAIRNMTIPSALGAILGALAPFETQLRSELLVEAPE